MFSPVSKATVFPKSLVHYLVLLAIEKCTKLLGRTVQGGIYFSAPVLNYIKTMIQSCTGDY